MQIVIHSHSRPYAGFILHKALPIKANIYLNYNREENMKPTNAHCTKPPATLHETLVLSMREVYTNLYYKNLQDGTRIRVLLNTSHKVLTVHVRVVLSSHVRIV